MAALALVAAVGMAMARSLMRLNVGCGDWRLPGWINCDMDTSLPVDIAVRVPPLPFRDGSLSEIYAGHFLEHLTPEDAHEFLLECWRCLVSGGKLGLLVPDTREIMRRYLTGSTTRVEYPEGVFRSVADLDEICKLFLYSTIQDSPHRWSYDSQTLRRAIERVGLECTEEIDRFCDPRIPVGSWYQVGWEAVKV